MRSVAHVWCLTEALGVGSYDANTGGGYGRVGSPCGLGRSWEQDSLYPYKTDSTTLDDIGYDDADAPDSDDVDALAAKTLGGHLVTNRLGNRIRDLGSFVDGASRLDLAHLVRLVIEDNFYTVGSRSSGMQSRVSGTTRGWSAPVAPLPWDEAALDHAADPDRVWSLEDVADETDTPRQLQRQKRVTSQRS